MPATRPLFTLAAMAIARGLITGCAVGPDYVRPEVKLTTAFHSSVLTPPHAASAPAQGEPWWTAFGDTDLSRAVERAASENLDLRAAQARLDQSRAFARASDAARLPVADAQASIAADEQSLNAPIGAIGRRLPGFKRDVGEVSLGLGAVWEADLFGGARRRREAAYADADASKADMAAVRLAVEADAADAYIQIRQLQTRIALVRRQEIVEADIVALVQRRVGEGVSPERDLQSALAALEGVRSDIPVLNEALEAAFNRLDVLTGVQPGAGRSRLAAGVSIPRAPWPRGSIRPVDLLRNRPDLAAAERRLSAANARVGAAIAAYFPDLSLSALAGFDSLSPQAVFAGSSAQGAAQAGLRWRLFDFGRIDGEVAQARGRQAEALATFRKAVLRATEEVENSFTKLTESRRRADILKRRIAALERTRRQAAAAYDGGLASLIEVRDSDRELLLTSEQLVQAEADAASASIAAFRSLGVAR